MNNKFCSSLFISSKLYPHVHQVFRPRYNKEFFKRLTKNLDSLERHVKLRCQNSDILSRNNLEIVKKESKQFVKLKDIIEEYDGDKEDAEFQKKLAQLDLVQEKILPIALALPNRFHKDVPEFDTVIEELKTDFASKQNLSKVLSHIKLSYINGCYSKSVVGPNSHYYQGIGAKLQHGMSNFFTHELERRKFILTSGLCIAKSALVEASNHKDTKDYTKDPCRMTLPESKFTTLHLVEASREALVGFATTFGQLTSNNPMRLFSVGSGYRSGQLWFDGNHDKVSQFQTAHALIIAPSVEAYSVKEYKNFVETIWDIYKNLQLPLRLVHCSLDNMNPSEFDAHRIDVWLPSRQEWIQVSRISHYLNYITVRVGMKRGHFLDSMVYDGQALGAAIIENRQTAQGRFIIPSALRNHMPKLTEGEKQNYTDGSSRLQAIQEHLSLSSIPIKTMETKINMEQRRYLVKRNYRFGHSKEAYNRIQGRLSRYIVLTGACCVLCLLDFEDVWMRLTPRPLQTFVYDHMFRPVRKLWWRFIYPADKIPPDLPFEKIDKTLYPMTGLQRNKYRVDHDPARSRIMKERVKMTDE